MLFDSYRKLLDFEVKPLNFDKLNSSTMKLAAFISAVDVIDERIINGSLEGVAWDILTSDIAKAKSTYSEVIKSSDFEIPDDISAKYKRVIKAYDEQQLRRKGIISEKINEINGHVKSASISDTESFINIARPAYDSLNAWSNSFFGDTDKMALEYKAFFKALQELSLLVIKIEQGINASRERVIAVIDLIDRALNNQITSHNYTACVNLVGEIDKRYKLLSAKEKSRVTNYDEYKKYLVKFNAERNRIDAKWRRDSINKAIRATVLNFLKSAWVVVLLVGLCFIACLITKQNWFFVAPKWLFDHDIAFYHWHAWDWKLMTMGFDVDLFLIDLVAGVLGLAVDLLIYVLQAAFWLICAVLWPVRWLISRAGGCIVYALAYGLPVILGGAGVTGVVFLGRGKSRIVNIVLCVAIVILTYLCIYVWL